LNIICNNILVTRSVWGLQCVGGGVGYVGAPVAVGACVAVGSGVGNDEGVCDG
jgi:hypothetical protein